MTQLKDDCFAHGEELTRLDDALGDLLGRLGTVVGTESVPLMDALGRILAADLVAGRDVPPADNSAVDGYAVAFDDLAADGETRLPVGGRITAGHPLGRPARPGEALRIFTGAPMPDGADTVFMQEDVRRDGDDVIVPAGIKRGANHRFRGEDVASGEAVLAAGNRLRAQEIGLAASLGADRLQVFKRLAVAVFSTGDEVRDPSQDAPEGCIFDANRFTVMSLLAGLGCAVSDLGIVADDEGAIAATLAEAAQTHDLIVTSGGVSLGEEDHVKDAVRRLGSIHLWRLAIKPGRPIAFGQIGGADTGAAFVGLPGNPVAAMVTFMRIARPMIARLSGASYRDPKFVRVPAAFSFAKKKGRREWLRVRLEAGVDGTFCAHRHPAAGAGILTSMVWSDGLLELPEDTTEVKEGDLVDYLAFTEIG